MRCRKRMNKLTDLKPKGFNSSVTLVTRHTRLKMDSNCTKDERQISFATEWPTKSPPKKARNLARMTLHREWAASRWENKHTQSKLIDLRFESYCLQHYSIHMVLRQVSIVCYRHEKQNAINTFEKYLGQRESTHTAFQRASRDLNIPVRKIQEFTTEKATTGELKDNHRKRKSRRNFFERLDDFQKNGIRKAVGFFMSMQLRCGCLLLNYLGAQTDPRCSGSCQSESRHFWHDQIPNASPDS